MKTTLINKLEDISLVLGISLGLTQIETLLGIIILGFQLVLILFKCFRSLYNTIKSKKYTIEDLENIIKGTTEDLEKLKGDKNE